MGLRDRMKRAEKAAEEEMTEIPQKDGTVARFPRSAGMDAYMNLFDRLGAGEAAPPEHPLIAAARNSSEPEWSGSFYAVNTRDGTWTDLVEDLSE